MEKCRQILLLLLVTYSLSFSQEKLEVGGAIIIQNSEDSSPAPGTIRFNPTTNDFEGWNGLFWSSLTGHQFEIASVSDIEGNIYPTVKVGSQEWMAINLRTSKYKNNHDIILVSNDSAGNTTWKMANYGAHCVYDTTGSGYISFDVNHFGYLYNWYAVNDGRGLCPTGWHVPSDSEWTTLTDYLGGLSIAGGKMKEQGFSHWNFPNTAATNESGFTGLPSGYRSTDGGFGALGGYNYWWSSTESSSASAWHRGLFYNDDRAELFSYVLKELGFSVRCLKD